MSQLLAESVTKSYTGRRVVDGVSLNVNGGEVVGLLGPNGAGKTTTFHMMVGLVHPDGGKVLLNGDDLTAMPIYQRARAGLSYLPQESSVFRRLTVEENLLAILETLDLTDEEQRDRALLLVREIERFQDREEIFLHGQPPEHRRLLRQVAEPGAGALVNRHRREIIAVQQDFAAVRMHEADHHVKRRGLARAVRTQ